ncbi:glycerophosphodiester phosphodiesterase [Aquipuribacter sp. MA13-6]|uniref:glycerophosphodiester phosphodiesterase n=1 Tax=unclassified Aquipuribacter TaxID=2635084 RepID=UPI003EEAF738
MRRPPLPPSGRPLVIAHRGASMAEPEHTMAAMERAVADGADALECDVRLTRDRQPVCHHDADLDRTSDATGKLYTRSLAELQDVDFGDGKGVLTLRRLVEFCRDQPRPMGLSIETKHPSRWSWQVERMVVAELFQGLGKDLAGLPFVNIMSFSPIAVRRVAALAPGLERVRLRSHRAPIPQLSTSHATGLDIRLLRADPTVVRDCHEFGQRTYVWTVNTVEDMDLCVRLGVDGIITDDPATARVVVDRAYGAPGG